MSIGAHSRIHTDADERDTRTRVEMGGFAPRSRATAVAMVFVLAGLVAASFDGALANSCLDEVDRIAEKYRLDTDPPDATERLHSDDLADTGGLIEPPSTHDPAMVEPPPPNDELFAMPTTPIRPAPARPTDEKGDELSASERAFLESMLIAARAEAERGKEEDCYKRLRAVQSFLHGDSE